MYNRTFPLTGGHFATCRGSVNLLRKYAVPFTVGALL